MDVIFHKIIGFLGFALATALVFIFHEIGHYITAVLCRVPVESVTVGVGREVWARQGSAGTRWSVRMFPICGVVRLYPHEGETMTPEHSARAFINQKLWKRFLIVAAGPAANIFLGLFVLMMFYTFGGKPEAPSIITGVATGLPAEKAGMQPGDRIAMIDGQPVESFDDLDLIDDEHGQRTLSLRYERGGKAFDVKVRPVWTTYTDEKGFARAHGRIGVLNMHKPLWLTSVRSVNGVETKGKPGVARRLLRDVMDKTVVVGIEGPDGATDFYKVHPLKENNKGLFDPDNLDYDWVFLGPLKDNIFALYDPYTSFKMSLHETGRLIYGLTTQVVGRTTHVDRSLFQPEATVRPSDFPVKSYVFGFFHTMATISVVIALVNLVPLPWFDGGFLVVYLFELFAGAERARASQQHVRRLAVLLTVAVWLVVNIHAIKHVLH